MALLFAGQLIFSISADLRQQITMEVNDIDSESEQEKDDNTEEEKFRDAKHTYSLFQAFDLTGQKKSLREEILPESHHPENHTPPPEVI